MAKQDDYTRYTIRIPSELYDRIKEGAGDKSVNAELIETLERAYPPLTVNIKALSSFLHSLAGISAPDGDTDYGLLVNDALGSLDRPWTVKAGWDGSVTFYPYASKSDDIDN